MISGNVILNVIFNLMQPSFFIFFNFYFLTNIYICNVSMNKDII